MKKTLAAVAVLGAFAGSAMAANVELYGSVSTGLVYTHTKAGQVFDAASGNYVDRAAQNQVSMESAWAGDSVFGLTGEEELGNGWKVGFALENEFKSDTGALNDEEGKKLFDSMSYLWVGNDLVKVAAGNLGGTLASAGGDFDLVGGFDPLEAAYGNGGMGLFATRDMAVDNAIDVELTPIDGLKFSFQMSLEDDSGNTGWGQQEHYYGLGASYENGPLAVSAVAERVKYANNVDNKSASMYTIGASWDFDVVKPTFMYQHTEQLGLSTFCDGLFEEVMPVDDEDEIIDVATKTDSFLLGATAPLGDGTLGVSAQYAKIKFVDQDVKDGKAWVFGVAYNYELSKRTSLYAAGVCSKGQDSLKEVGAVNNYQIGFGLNHTF